MRYLPAFTLACSLAVASTGIGLAQQHPLTDPRALAADPEQFRGQRVTLIGEALTSHRRANGTLDVQFLARVPSAPTEWESVEVEIPDGPARLDRDRCYLLAGTAAGTITATRLATGLEVTVPLVTPSTSPSDITSLSESRFDPCPADAIRRLSQ